MHDIILERINLIKHHAQIVADRMQAIKSADDFKLSIEGEIILDSIITRLQALSENFKKIEKIDSTFAKEKLIIDVLPIIPFRDLASHHYELLNHNINFQSCRNEIPNMLHAVENYLKNYYNL